MTTRAEWIARAEVNPCPRCGAQPGERCRTSNGTLVSRKYGFHSSRGTDQRTNRVITRWAPDYNEVLVSKAIDATTSSRGTLHMILNHPDPDFQAILGTVAPGCEDEPNAHEQLTVRAFIECALADLDEFEQLQERR